MKIALLLWTVFINISLTHAQSKIDTLQTNRHNKFKLSYISIGLGSNMFKKQPRFEVNGTKFIYTSEEAWEFKNCKKAKPIKLYSGFIRLSSIDSILNFTKQIKVDSVYRLSPGVMSGGIIYLDIISPQKKLNFQLDNAFDEIAEKIVDILNGYIPKRIKKLWICDIHPEITEMK